MTFLDSRRLCFPAEQPGFPNCSLVRGNTVHQTPGPEVQKWHLVNLITHFNIEHLFLIVVIFCHLPKINLDSTLLNSLNLQSTFLPPPSALAAIYIWPILLYILWILFLCIAFYVLYSMQYSLCIVVYEKHYMHCIL